MPNIASEFKTEVARVARKETRAEMATLQSASSRYRSDLADLKRRCAALEREVTRLSKGKPARVSVVAPSGEEGEGTRMRWRPEAFKKFRAKLELSAAELGILIGCSGQSVYKWEEGQTRPRPTQLQAITAVKRLSKKQISAMLAEQN